MLSHSSSATLASPAPMQALWRLAAIGLPTGLALLLYWWSAAPALTWAHYGADGGDLLAAAVVNGVPHPSGYPLYTLLLRGWLWFGQLLDPQLDFAYWGNRLSALCVAGATAFTIAATAALLRDDALHNDARRWLWAALAGLTFAITPLAWSQALITEVYGLHALLVAALGWAALRHQDHQHHQRQEGTPTPLLLGLLMGLGAAHHLTSLLLWPVLLYWRLHALPLRVWWRACAVTLVVAGVTAGLFYGGMVWRVTAATQALPVAWGDPRDLSGLWWLISGAAYRAYVFGMTPLQYGGRLATLARILVEQFTPVGLALVIGGFAVWDRHQSWLRNGALLWALPISLYAAGYNTADSYIYLLPVVWLMSVALGQALASGSTWLARRSTHIAPGLQRALIATLVTVGLVALVGWRLPQLDLRHDQEAQAFLAAAATTLEPGSLVISSADAETFALWYGQWGSTFAGDSVLATAVPDLVIVNYALYQFGWYRDLLHDLYPDVPNMGASFAELIDANRSLRPIFLTEVLPIAPQAALTPTGAFWRLETPVPE